MSNSTPEDIENFIAELRNNGESIIESIKQVRVKFGVSLGDAKTLVSESRTWEDRREDDAKFHDELIKILEKDK